MRREDDFELYINGVKTTQLPFDPGFTFTDSTFPIIIDRLNGDTNQTAFDDLRIYTRSLNTTELDQVMNGKTAQEIDEAQSTQPPPGLSLAQRNLSPLMEKKFKSRSFMPTADRCDFGIRYATNT